MSFLSRLFGKGADPRDALRPLWFRVVEISRLPEYYARCGVADSVEGRFDMIVNVLALVLLRMEHSHMGRQSALLTELFVADMDGQLRESGVGDVMVGKHMGKLMGVLGGRLGALREALAEERDGALEQVLERNVSWSGSGDPACLAARLRGLRDDLARRSDKDILQGQIAR